MESVDVLWIECDDRTIFGGLKLSIPPGFGRKKYVESVIFCGALI